MARKFQEEFESLLQYERLLYEYDLKRMQPSQQDGSCDSFLVESTSKQHYTTHANLPLASSDVFADPPDSVHRRYNMASNPDIRLGSSQLFNFSKQKYQQFLRDGAARQNKWHELTN